MNSCIEKHRDSRRTSGSPRRTGTTANVIACLVLASLTAQADVTWNGSTDGSWNTAGNWEGGTKPYQACGMIIFGTAGAGNKTCTNNIGSTYNISGIIFTNGGDYTLVEGAGAGNYRDLPTGIMTYGGSNTVGNGITASDSLFPALVLATNTSWLTIGGPMGWGGGWGAMRASSDSTIVFNGAISSGNMAFYGQGNYILNGSVSLPGWMYLDAGTITLNANNTLSGSIRDGLAVLIAGGGARSFQSGNLYGAGGDYLFGGTNDFTFSGKIGRGAGHPNINVTNQSVRVTFLGGASGIPNNDVLTTKKGPGTLVIGGTTSLGNNRKYQVNAGTLLLLNSTNTWVDNNANDAITVASGGTLGGMYTEVNLIASRVVRVQSGGKINPGDPRANNGIGTLTLGTSGSPGNTIFESGSTLSIDVGAGTNDVLVVNGNLTLTGSTLDLNQVTGQEPQGGTYTIASFSGSRTGSFSTTNYNGSAEYLISYLANSITLELTVSNGTIIFFE